ncbi:hypothetical protein [Allorhizobium undicola]|uniref:hypothetical protein n=1 Tax=Allorhizobium undicola TaxID=78527 RepID=UPI000A8CC942|nr:hypothetical protein [Allorhizobium undicola]
MNAPAILPANMAELPEVIERARCLFDQGDVQQALKLSSIAYDEAKAAARTGERVKASRAMIEKARRMQADALKIETICTIAMADAVDEAQAKGALLRGRPDKEKVQDADHFSLNDVGIDKRRLHEARQLRDAARADPGFVERIVETRIAEGLEPSRAALKKAAGHAIGTKTASDEERGLDLYETPVEAMHTLLALESFGLAVLEPSVGKGAILRPLEAAGYEVAIADFEDRGITTQYGEVQAVGDFLASVRAGDGFDIVTNPPYGIANAYIAHALREHQPRKMAMLLNLNFLAGFEDPDRCFAMDECPPSRIYVFTRRLPMMHRDGREGNKASSQMNTAWFIWERNEDGSYGGGFPQMIRVDWAKFQQAEPLAPGAGGCISPLVFAEPEEDFSRKTPRKTLDERVSEELARALIFAAEREEGFDTVTLRRGIGVRDSVAVALIEDMAAGELIARLDDAQWRITDKGLTALAATAAVLAGRKISHIVELEGE